MRFCASGAEVQKVSNSACFSLSSGRKIFAHSNNNELLIINLATVRGRRISIIPPAESFS